MPLVSFIRFISFKPGNSPIVQPSEAIKHVDETHHEFTRTSSLPRLASYKACTWCPDLLKKER